MSGPGGSSRPPRGAGPAAHRGERRGRLAERFQTLLHQAKGEADVTLLERLGSDSAAVQREVEELLDEFATSSQEVLSKLSHQAGLQNVPAHLARPPLP